jgi:hypothetical protein
MNINVSDAIANSPQSILHNATNLISQCLVTFDVVIRMDLDLHGGFLLSVWLAQSSFCDSSNHCRASVE